MICRDGSENRAIMMKVRENYMENVTRSFWTKAMLCTVIFDTFELNCAQ